MRAWVEYRWCRGGSYSFLAQNLQNSKGLTPVSSRKVTRREFVGSATFLALGLPVVLGRGYPAMAGQVKAGAAYVPPQSPRATLNFNLDWRFVREDVAGAEAAGFDDAKWETVSTPHS